MVRQSWNCPYPFKRHKEYMEKTDLCHDANSLYSLQILVAYLNNMNKYEYETRGSVSAAGCYTTRHWSSTHICKPSSNRKVMWKSHVNNYSLVFRHFLLWTFTCSYFFIIIIYFLCNMIHMIHLYWGDYYFWWLIYLNVWLYTWFIYCHVCFLLDSFLLTWFQHMIHLFSCLIFFPQMWFKWNLKFKLIMNSACNYLIFAWSHTGLITCVVSEYNMLKRTFTFVCLFDIITCEKTSCDFP